MKEVVVGQRVRRKRSWYRRRLRRQRLLVAVVFAGVIAGACWQSAARYFGLPTLHAAQVLPDFLRVQPNIHRDLALMAARSARTARAFGGTRVYPYSIVPGGVSSPAALREAAARDYVVRRHYANFDFNHARVIRAAEARKVYLSYRIRDKIFWTRQKISLHTGELLLTDGNVTARARCGNQISETAKPEVSDEEPADDVLDQPVAELPAPSSPARRMLAPPDLPAGEPAAPKLFASGFSFPYVPYGVPIPSGLCAYKDGVLPPRCRPKHKPPVVPEPSTMLLLASGLALIGWRYRRSVCSAPAQTLA